MRAYVLTILFLFSLGAQAAQWNTHFAYQNVERIAVTPTEVFAISDGSLYSVNKRTEQIELWDMTRGLHHSTACAIAYNAVSNSTLICYTNGMMDMIEGGNVVYAPDLYLEEMTQQKIVNNITMLGQNAYLAMTFGVLVWDMQRKEFADTWYIGSEARDVNVQTVFFENGNVYAVTATELYVADATAHLADYHNWHTEPLPTNGTLWDAWQQSLKKVIQDGSVTWSCGGTMGIHATGPALDTYYKPEGPLNNLPYSMKVEDGKLFVLSGGRWADKFWRPVGISYFDGRHWQQITPETINAAYGCYSSDYLRIAVDPNQSNRWYVGVYSSGLHVFENGVPTMRYNSQNSSLTCAAGPGIEEDGYTRTDYPCFDSQGRLWLMNATKQNKCLHVRTPDGNWYGMHIRDGETGDVEYYDTPGGLLLNCKDERYLWVAQARWRPHVALVNTGADPLTDADDTTLIRRQWVDQDGQVFAPLYIYCMAQDSSGACWIGTEHGVICVGDIQAFQQSGTCRRLRIDVAGNNDALADEVVNDLLFDQYDRLYVGTTEQGVYVLDTDHETLLHHWLPGETPMSSTAVLSLAEDKSRERIYVGTRTGIVSYTEGNETALDPRTPMEVYDEEQYSGLMGSWTLHMAYHSVDEVVVNNRYAYGLADGSLFSVDKETEEVVKLNTLSGLSDSRIGSIWYDGTTRQLMIAYQNGNIDLMQENGAVANVSDLKRAQVVGDKVVRTAVFREGNLYLGMSFGVVKLNLRKHELSDTYYIGHNSTAVEVLSIAFHGDSIYAYSQDSVYRAHFSANLVDYNQWETAPIREANMSYIQAIRKDTVQDGSRKWIAGGEEGLIYYDEQGYRHMYRPSGPLQNSPYAIATSEDRLIVVPGGRWAVEYQINGCLMVYEDDEWKNRSTYELQCEPVVNYYGVRDLVRVAIDPKDKHHFYACSYGNGLLEFRDDHVVNYFHFDNSPLWSAALDNPWWYTRTDGASFDKDGNLWVGVAGGNGDNVMVIDRNGNWSSNSFSQHLDTPGEILHDNHRKGYHWVLNCRGPIGIGLIYDNGTPADLRDDRMILRNSFVDQHGREIQPSALYCMSQDHDGRIWIGTNEGIFTIPANADFFASNAVHRPIVNRTDGSGLADYLMDNQVVRAIVHDGGNRHWFGTTGEGAFLITYLDDRTSATTCTALYHFTMDNSPLPSNNILSIGISPLTGEVFFGTESGIASFRADASEGREDYDDAYAYPNPVRPGYEGNITFAGLMADSYVKIVDEGGNVVLSARSNGGTLVWNGKNTAGHRVAPGVYRAFCNRADGEHTIVKVMVLR